MPNTGVDPRVKALEIFVLSLLIEVLEDPMPANDKAQNLSFIASALNVFSEDAQRASESLYVNPTGNAVDQLHTIKREFKSISEEK